MEALHLQVEQSFQEMRNPGVAVSFREKILHVAMFHPGDEYPLQPKVFRRFIQLRQEYEEQITWNHGGFSIRDHNTGTITGVMKVLNVILKYRNKKIQVDLKIKDGVVIEKNH
jgi:hypothetical protein